MEMKDLWLVIAIPGAANVVKNDKKNKPKKGDFQICVASKLIFKTCKLVRAKKAEDKRR